MTGGSAQLCPDCSPPPGLPQPHPRSLQVPKGQVQRGPGGSPSSELWAQGHSCTVVPSHLALCSGHTAPSTKPKSGVPKVTVPTLLQEPRATIGAGVKGRPSSQGALRATCCEPAVVQTQRRQPTKEAGLLEAPYN